MKLKSNNGFSLVVAIGLIFLISMLALYLVEYMIPFSRNVKGIENSSVSYYQANSGLEEAIWAVNKNSVGTNTGLALPLASMGYGFTLVGTGDSLPPIGEGNSEFDNDWNIIHQGEPVQLSVGNNMPTIADFSGVEIFFRTPDLNSDTNYTETLSGSSALPIINWQLSGSGDTLAASGSYVDVGQLNLANVSGVNIDISLQEGSTLTGSIMDAQTFYTAHCGPLKDCTLKYSVVNTLELTNTTLVPYLEWKITDPSSQLSLRFARITGEGKSYGFKKRLDIKLSQDTGIGAFDFAVFQ